MPIMAEQIKKRKSRNLAADGFLSEEDHQRRKLASSSIPTRKVHDASPKNSNALRGYSGQQQTIAQLAAKGVFSAGNYSSYYAKRLPPGSRDPRIDVMNRAWFQNKSCLDIGCNVGLVSVEFIRTLGASKVRAIDIDNSLILRARAAAKNIPYPRNEELAKRLLDVSWVPASFELSIGPLKTLAHYITFDCEDYVESGDCNDEEYDVVTCLSTIKWVHLNNGDSGVQRLFHKVYKSLKPRGIFILEPQPWKSYRKSRLLTPEIKAHFTSIKLKPVDFKEFLVQKVGFSRIETISNDSGCVESGFATSQGQQRSIYACFKE
eukprot:m.399783 g.399783  ORF g.399783 m.399783 type:complete len:320 (+) comp21155_c0_seq3:166-1125(+)